ncbi:MAG TPA: 30S ribosomal protein S6 [Candidatus Paceibacterota bacterium]|nr:30S ribosomal protein S6 [Candidatus Paceibacterota bacterium]
MAKNQDEDVLVTEPEDMGAEARVYELGFHLDPELPTEEVKKAYQAVRELIAGKGAIVAEVEPEKIQLAYTISRQEVAGRRDFNSAYFAWIVYETDAPKHAEVIAAADANKLIIRFIDLVTDKDVARHALEVHELMAKVPETESSPEEVLNTELDAALESAAV